MVDRTRRELLNRNDLPFSHDHVDPLFTTTERYYSAFSSLAHGGMTPVDWTLSDETGVMQFRFALHVRCTSALILGEPVTQASMVHLALHGLTADLNLLIRKQHDLTRPEVQRRILAEAQAWEARHRDRKASAAQTGQ